MATDDTNQQEAPPAAPPPLFSETDVAPGRMWEYTKIRHHVSRPVKHEITAVDGNNVLSTATLPNGEVFSGMPLLKSDLLRGRGGKYNEGIWRPLDRPAGPTEVYIWALELVRGFRDQKRALKDAQKNSNSHHWFENLQKRERALLARMSEFVGKLPNDYGEDDDEEDEDAETEKEVALSLAPMSGDGNAPE